MKKEVGIWLDHRHAVLVINLDQEEEIQHIASHAEENAHESNKGDNDDNRFANQLKHYYDEIIVQLQDATSILILGPGEARTELHKRLESRGFQDTKVSIKPTDKLTEPQIIAEVHQHFLTS